ncbi:MAG: hypothetical protein HRU13_11860 [Phycisphaerales bacterium]|nr:hypothetical protein [Phycisphaerales bacterium]
MSQGERQGGRHRSGAGRLRVLLTTANRWRQTRWFRIGGFVVGAALVVLAIAAALKQDPEAMRRSLQALGDHPLWFAALFVVLPLLNWLSISASIWVLLARFGRVGMGEMLALVGMAWLLNYLPMRPGMVGRVAYHKAVNKIGVRQTGQTLLEGVVITGVVSGIMLLGALVLRGAQPLVAWSVMVLVPMLAGGAVSAGLWAKRPLIARYCASGSLRVIDMAVWAMRYALAFAIVGSSIDLSTALVLAVVSQIAMLIPISGNGLGIREWLIGVLAASLPTAALAGSESALAHGLTADVLNRVAEVLVAIPLGLICIGLIGRRLRQIRRSGAATTTPQGLP